MSCLTAAKRSRILVGVGPGSFTGIRVGIAAAHGLAIGWGAEIAGMSSLALIAAGVRQPGEVAVAITGGHGELFVQSFDGMTAEPLSDLINLPPAEAAAATRAPLVVGSGAKQLVEARGSGEAREAWPSAANALRLPSALRGLAAQAGLRPRARRSRPRGGLMATPAIARKSGSQPGTSSDLDAVMAVMESAFGNRFGEAWTRSQLSRDPADDGG